MRREASRTKENGEAFADEGLREEERRGNLASRVETLRMRIVELENDFTLFVLGDESGQQRVVEEVAGKPPPYLFYAAHGVTRTADARRVYVRLQDLWESPDEALRDRRREAETALESLAQ